MRLESVTLSYGANDRRSNDVDGQLVRMAAMA
jgi:hypothetical protein